MSGILDLLNSPTGKQLIEGAAGQLGLDKGKAGTAIQAAMPLILGAMKNNTQSQENGSGLLNAVLSDRHNGNILDNLGNILGGSEIDKDVLQDGEGILGHVFGGRQENVAAAVSKSSGVEQGSAFDLLKVAAPVLMGVLGKQSREAGVSSANDLEGLLGGLLGGQSEKSQGMINQLLDADGDGSVIDDVAEMLTGSGNKKDGGLLGNLLGGLFGGK
jgi:hypothetical protein